jgi:cytidylate kinase
MSYKVITIGRQFGSGGHNVGEKLAEKLGYNYYNRKLIELAAEKSGMSHSVLTDADEKASSPWVYASMSQSGQANFGINLSTNDVLFNVQSEIIRNIADTENAVIVGRCADYILKDRDVELVNVFIYAPLDARVKRTMEREGISEAAALAKIKRHDKQRRLYYDFYTDRKWSSHVNYDLTINSEKFGIDGTVDMIYNAVK